MTDDVSAVDTSGAAPDAVPRRRNRDKLPVSMQRYFDKRMAEIAADPRPPVEGISITTQLNLLVIAIALFAIGVVAFLEYDLNLAEILFEYIVQMLDPGQPPTSSPTA